MTDDIFDTFQLFPKLSSYKTFLKIGDKEFEDPFSNPGTLTISFKDNGEIRNIHLERMEVALTCNVYTLYNIGVDKPITPSEKLPELPKIPRGGLVVVSGRAPIWRYCQAFHLLHGSPAGAIAVYDPRLGAVVVASHSPEYEEGTVLEVNIE